MEESLTLKVSPHFDMDAFAEKLASACRAEGYTADVVNLYGAKKLRIYKDCAGIKNLLGLGQDIRVSCSLHQGVLQLDYTDGNWTCKIFTLVIGIFFAFCLIGIPFLICSVIGIIRQSSLPGKISGFVSGMIGKSAVPHDPYQNPTF
ncbi:MAG: hypothetical protein ACI4I5_05345 [Acutalibacteraceae bacterium]